MADFHHVPIADFVVLHEDRGRVLDLDELMAAAQEVERELEGRTARVLIDCRGVAKDYSFADAYRLAQAFREAPGFETGHVAIVGEYDEEFEKAQAVAFHFQEAGSDVRAFLSYEEAAAWLAEDLPGTTG
jgi:hypothetical protein